MAHTSYEPIAESVFRIGMFAHDVRFRGSMSRFQRKALAYHHSSKSIFRPLDGKHLAALVVRAGTDEDRIAGLRGGGVDGGLYRTECLLRRRAVVSGGDVRRRIVHPFRVVVVVIHIPRVGRERCRGGGDGGTAEQNLFHGIYPSC